MTWYDRVVCWLAEGPISEFHAVRHSGLPSTSFIVCLVRLISSLLKEGRLIVREVWLIVVVVWVADESVVLVLVWGVGERYA